MLCSEVLRELVIAFTLEFVLVGRTFAELWTVDRLVQLVGYVKDARQFDDSLAEAQTVNLHAHLDGIVFPGVITEVDELPDTVLPLAQHGRCVILALAGLELVFGASHLPRLREVV